MQADILDIPSLEKAMREVEEVYHCAAALGDMDFDQIKLVNVRGTRFVVDVAMAAGVQNLCYVSSIATLGNPIKSKSVTEEDFFNPDALNTDYAISKYGGEMEVWRASQEGLNVVIVNPGVILGEGDYESGSGRIFTKTYQKQPFYTTGSSGFVDVRDVVEFMHRSMQEQIYGHRFILIEGNYTFKNLLDRIASALNRRAPWWRLRPWILYVIYVIFKIPSMLGWIDGIDRADIKTLFSRGSYDNLKSLQHFDFEYTPMEDTIQRISADFIQSVED
jgi:nucleoside-diphosphate-sugar epimerase